MTETAGPTPSNDAATLPRTHVEGWPLDKTYIGKAMPREGGGWIVRILTPDPEAEDQARLIGLTECATLEQLEQKTWDFVRAFTGEKDVHITTAPDIGDELMMRVIGAWKAMKDAKEAEAQAARRTREVVKELRERGLSVTDIAFVAHVSRGRVSQLLM